MLATLFALSLAQGLYGPAEHPAFTSKRELFSLGDLPIAVSYPEGAKGKLPVIVWSHGMYGSRTTYKPLIDALVGNGYVVILPSHGDSISRMTPEQRQALLANPNTGATQSWKDRPGEVSKCIGSFAEIEAKVSALKGRLDAARVAVGGHSFGAWTTQALSGMDLRTLGRTQNFYEPRAKAFVVMSGSGTGGQISEEGLKKMHGPMLFLTGTNDNGRKGEAPSWRKEAFDKAAAGDKWLVWIDGCAHNYGGITGEKAAAARTFLKRAGTTADSNPKHTAIAISAVVAFYHAYVKGLPDAKSYLKEKKLEGAGGVTVSSK